MTTKPRLLQELINIPTAVHKGDLVFQLGDAADDAAATMANYVVTEQLLSAFLDAVGLLRSAITDNSSKAAFLHGSFGSGKSNFMGVLQLLLDGNPAARAKPELAPVVAKLGEWKGARRFLTVPFHLIGESDLESAVFGQYVRHLRRIHPDAPPPAVFADEPILQNADELRKSVGEQAFLAKLSSGNAGGGWGDLDAAWDATSYEAARHAPHGSPDRTRLVQAVLTTWLTSFAEAANANKGGYVSFEDGLSAISVHARGLGFDGVMLFLDELILWFLSRLGDTAWVSEEASKLSKLVEAASATRPVPIVSLIARQRDLRELVGDNVLGIERLGFADQLDYQAGRFDTITLDDSNLPLVANRRLLTPVHDGAKAELDAAFTSLSLSARVHDVLLAESGNDDSFRLTYPFSPAFMTVLVDVAGALQRTRTGLRVLLDLLVARRDVLEVGQLVPVGDLYDVIDVSDDPFSDAMRASFDQARKIYKERLRAALLADHNLGPTDAPTTAFINDDRLVKTLLLAALVPQSVPFRNLTVERLVALNHGTISSPIPGQETAIATNKLRHLAAHVGELSLGSDPSNPSVSIRLSGVDTASILASADGVDNTAMRRTLVRQLLLSALGLPPDQMQTTYTLVWNGLRRDVTVVFGNVRDAANLPDTTFANDDRSNWKLIVDFPFDDSPHGLLDDLERLDRLRQNGASWSTLCWLPSFFASATLDVLGRLVRLNHVLASDQRFTEATSTLSPVDRAAARPVLENMRAAARNQIDAALLGAYGVVTADEKVVDVGPNLSDHFQSLKTGLAIAPPTKANLRDALDQVLDQALRHTYPGAPDLGTEVKPGEVRKVAELCTEAVVEPDGRLMVKEPTDRKLLARIANPLQLGIQSEQAFKLSTAADRWDNTFTKAINQALQNGADTQTVGVLREAINAPSPMGLTSQLENLIILVWAQATNHTFRLHGGPVMPTVDRLEDAWEVVPQALPSEEVWEKAHGRMASIFGITLATRHLSGFAVERAGIDLQKMVDAHRTAVDALVDKVASVGSSTGIDEAAFPRLASARAARALLANLAAAPDDLTRVGALATAPIPTSELALGKSISSAQMIVNELGAAQLSIIEAAAARAEGAHLGSELKQALEADELVTALIPELHRIQEAAIALITVKPKPSYQPSKNEWKGHDLQAARIQLDTLQARVEAKELSPDAIEVTILWNEPE